MRIPVIAMSVLAACALSPLASAESTNATDPRIGQLLAELGKVHGVQAVQLSPDGARLAWVVESGDQTAIHLAAADGSGARAVASDIAAARLTRDGSAVIAVLASNQHVERLPLAAGATPTPLAGPVDRVVAVSPDGNYLTYSTMSDPTTFSTDLVLASAVSAGSVTSLVATNTSQSTSYAFSDDSAFALYVDAYDADAFTGTLHALPTAGGTTPRLLGNAVYDQATVGASRLVFEDNTSGTFPNQHADVEFVDLAQSAAPTRLATQALVQLWVDADNHTLYAVQSDGLHIIALP